MVRLPRPLNISGPYFFRIFTYIFPLLKKNRDICSVSSLGKPRKFQTEPNKHNYF